MLSIFAITLLLGVLVGFLAGMLGIGGGLIIVPALVMLLPAFGIVPADQAIVVAIATSLASVIITATSSVAAHHRLENVPWNIASTVMVGAAVGAWAVGYLAHNIDAGVLQMIFGCAVLLLALRMLGSRAAVGKRPLPGKLPTMTISAVLGGVASLLGIGGGALFVPMLNYFSLDMRRAIGVAAASGIAIAIFGSLGYVVAGWQHYQLTDGFIGYIYMPAALGIVTTSVFTAPLGAKLVQHLPVLTIKRIFGIFMLLVSAKMILS
ncbi:sulfite exporter TauE/SafE family protein [Rheinheimera baltica]|uniref:sulfite exporter TauE/SafE family protein n=1 Tax=Rheinheimera baltica TaxID=67576 RepID=UPI00273D164B|nr:sulfite exporter TauE/SafE family protein [Rheinheimera baltica]MDP5143219.1 sulfite exporter TauE/SafE family protein [Rheinheimera baltica]